MVKGGNCARFPHLTVYVIRLVRRFSKTCLSSQIDLFSFVTYWIGGANGSHADLGQWCCLIARPCLSKASSFSIFFSILTSTLVLSDKSFSFD